MITKKVQKTIDSIKNGTIKNTLLMYQGGGYDGCIWENNWGVFDDNSKWISIYASGSMGCKTVEKLLAQFEDVLYDNEFDLYEFNKLDEFAKEYNVTTVKYVATSLEQHKIDFEMNAECYYCGYKFPVLAMELQGWHGAGGIVSVADELICEDCMLIHTCAYCGEFITDETTINDQSRCESCAEEAEKRIKESLGSDVYKNYVQSANSKEE